MATKIYEHAPILFYTFDFPAFMEKVYNNQFQKADENTGELRDLTGDEKTELNTNIIKALDDIAEKGDQSALDKALADPISLFPDIVDITQQTKETERSKEMSELYDYNNPEDVKKAMAEMEAFLNADKDLHDQIDNIPRALEAELKKDCSILENTTANLQNELVTRTATNESIEKATNDAQERVDKNLTETERKLMEENAELRKRLESLESRSVFKEMGHEVVDGVKFVGDKAKEGLDKAGEAVKGAFSKARDFFKGAFDKVKEVCKEGLELGLKGIGTAVTKMHEIVDNTRQKCYDLVQDVKGKCKEILNDIDRNKADKEYEKAQKALEKAKEKFDKYQDKANDHYEKMAEANDRIANRG